MVRSSQNDITRKHKKNVLKNTKGFRGPKGVNYRPSNQAYLKSQNNAYKDRKTKKRFFKQLWVSRINAGLSYKLNWSTFHYIFLKRNIYLNRKICSFIALQDISCFQKILHHILENK